MATRTETDDEIRVTASTNTFCIHGGEITEVEGGHEHVWTKPKRCPEVLWVSDSVGIRCKHDAGHDSGEFPRRAWDDGLDGVRRFVTERTPHLAEWARS